MRAVILAFLVTTCIAQWTVQSVGVKGVLMCGGEPAAVFDTKLAETLTDRDGFFKLWGSARELSDIDPRLDIYHRCNHHGARIHFLVHLGDERRTRIKIPSKYIVRGLGVPEDKYFDVRRLRLDHEIREA
ncbi:Transthyretin-like family protein [Ancylostoma ceylanicum]|uniref:Transthyretin-like family protein n=1 Tax=Ancylostoma ceylanicum TaxID=53326 RepID=A0A0D6LN74_9BILA|nr:Transthyretin-like family protein [Ancylostoma ceylanicum]